MFGGMGGPELFLLFVVGAMLAISLIPIAAVIAAVVWGVNTLQRDRKGQDELRTRLDAIEREINSKGK